jgi:hypothetical protein
MPTLQLDLLEIERRPARSREEILLRIAEKQHCDVQCYCGYVEPDYDDKPVVLGDWNDRREYNRETGQSRVVNKTMPRLAKLFGKLGYSVEWEDEWASCEDCGKVFRTSPDSYSWRMYGWISDGFCLCGDCIKKNPADYLEHLSGNHRSATTFDIDLIANGYVLRAKGFEDGFYDQHDSPEAIAKGLHDKGITDFIFAIDNTGQFSTGFSVWIKKPGSVEDDE